MSHAEQGRRLNRKSGWIFPVSGTQSVFSLKKEATIFHFYARRNLTERPECRMLIRPCYMTRNATSSTPSAEMEEDPRYLTEQIVTYLGNKRSLLHFLGTGLEHVKSRLGRNKLKAGDLFSGSGVVARFLKKHSKELIVNDLEEYSGIVNTCYLSNPEEVENLELDRHYRRLLRYMETHESPGFITELYAPKNPNNITPDDRVFYTRRNALYLDTARQTINLLPEEVRPYFIAPPPGGGFRPCEHVRRIQGILQGQAGSRQIRRYGRQRPFPHPGGYFTSVSRVFQIRLPVFHPLPRRQ